MIGNFTSQETALMHYTGSTTRDICVLSHKTAARVHRIFEDVSDDVARGLFIIAWLIRSVSCPFTLNLCNTLSYLNISVKLGSNQSKYCR